MSSGHIGNAGEHYVMACLLEQGIHAGLADRGNPHFDILIRTEAGDFRAVRVKTTRSDTFQWTAKTELNPLPGFDVAAPDSNDISVLVAFNKERPGVNTEVYVIPTERIAKDLNEIFEHYHRFPKRDGSPRKRSAQRVIRLDGVPREDNIAYGFRETWRAYLHNWTLLKGAE